MRKSLLLLFLAAGVVSRAQNFRIVSDINPGAAGSGPTQTTVYNGAVYFIADDGAHGKELWRYTGSGSPTLIYDLNPGAGAGAFGINSGSAPMAVLNNKLYFQGIDSNSTHMGLFVYDGINHPKLAPNIPGNVNPTFLTVYGSRIYYVSASDLWSYDGVNAPVKISINTGTAQGFPQEPTPFNGKIICRGRNGAYGEELFAYDTSTATVSLVKDINAGALSSYPQSLTLLNGKLYFFALENSTGYELYSYDGTTTTRLTDLAPGAVSGVMINSFSAGALNNDLYFVGTANGTKYDLYKYRTASSDAVLVYPFGASISDGRAPQFFTPYHGRLYFRAKKDTDSTGIELWRTDGTTTELAADVCAGGCEGRASNFSVFGSDLYFSATSLAYGYELYRYNDSAAASLGISRTGLDGSVTVYPNPAHEAASLELSLPAAQSLSVSVSDISGRRIWNGELAHYEAGKSIVALPVADMQPGLYFFHVCGANRMELAAGKILVQ